METEPARISEGRKVVFQTDDGPVLGWIYKVYDLDLEIETLGDESQLGRRLVETYDEVWEKRKAKEAGWE